MQLARKTKPTYVIKRKKVNPGVEARNKIRKRAFMLVDCETEQQKRKFGKQMLVRIPKDVKPV